MKTIFILFFSFCAYSVFAQDSLPVYKKYPVVPLFKLSIAPDSLLFTKDNLKKKKPVIIMIFSPDCDHCHHAMKDILEHYNLFKKIQLVMASSLDYKLVKKFYEDYHIAAYPNIVMGRDASYYLASYYQVHNFPAYFLYDKKGKFVTSFEGSVAVEKLAAGVR